MPAENNIKLVALDENSTVETHEEVQAHGVADESLASSLGLNMQLFLFQLLNFAVVAAIVWFLILRPLSKKLEERKKMIDESIDNAKEIETNLQMSEKKYQEKIDEAKVKANKITEKMMEENKLMANKLKEIAQEDVGLLVAQAKKNIQIDKQEMKTQIRKETAEMIILAMEKIFDKKMDEKMDEKFISDILKDLDKKQK